MTTVPALNIIQNLDPTDTIMITHADGSTERFSASKIIPTDQVAANNMQSVTSNAVARNYIHAIRDYWTTDINNPFDVLSIIESYGDLLYGMSEEIKIRIGYYVTNSPLGSGVQNSDMFYLIRKTSVSNNNWIRVTAIDVRSNNIYAICKRDGYWQSWQEITSNAEIYGSATLDPNYVKSGTIRWVKRGKFCTLNFESVVFQNISGYSETPFATGIPRPLFVSGSYGVLQYDTMEEHGFVNISNINNNGVIKPDAFLNVNADTYGAIVYMTAD